MAKKIAIRPDEVATAAQLKGLPPELALAIWKQESGQNSSVGNSAKGAVGGFQVMPDTFNRYLPGGDINDPVDNMEAGLRVLADGHKRSGGSHEGTAQFYYHGKILPPGVEGPNSGPGTPTTRQYGQQVAAKAQQIAAQRGSAPTGMAALATAPGNTTATAAPDDFGLADDFSQDGPQVAGLEQDVDIPGLTRGFNEGPFGGGEADLAMNEEGSQNYDLDQYIRKLVDDEFRPNG